MGNTEDNKANTDKNGRENKEGRALGRRRSLRPHLKVAFDAVHGSVVNDLSEPRVPGGEVERIGMEDDVEDPTPDVLLVEVVPRRCQAVRNGPLESPMSLLVGGLTRGFANGVVLADIEETLGVAVDARLYDVTRLGINERHVDAPLLLQLRDLSFVDLPVLRVTNLLGVLDEELAKLVLLHALGDVLQFVATHLQILPVFLAILVRLHVVVCGFVCDSLR